MLAAVFLFATGFAPAADVAVPVLKARVTDLTATLSAEQTAALENKLAAFETKKGSQLAVLLVPTTQPETIEQYSIRVVEQWKLGRKGVDDGILLLIAKNDRKLRIEVGRGLEGALPDAIAKRIIDEYITPPFKQGDFNGGVNAGVDRIIKVVDGEPLPAPSGRGKSRSMAVDDALTWAALLVIFVGGVLRAIFGSFFGALVAAGIAGVIVFFFGAGGIMVLIVMVIVFIFTLLGVLGGGGSGSSSSGGGYSGGGGSFGGGGASGSW